MKKYTKLLALAAAILSISALSGCVKKSDSANGQKQRTVRIATKGTAKPYITRDEEGNLGGYDTAVIKAIFELLFGSYSTPITVASISTLFLLKSITLYFLLLPPP